MIFIHDQRILADAGARALVGWCRARSWSAGRATASNNTPERVTTGSPVPQGEMHPAMNTATIIGAVGPCTTLAGTLLGPLLQGRQAVRREWNARLRDMRIQLYVEILTHIEAQEQYLEWTLLDVRPIRPRRPEGLPNNANIAARLELLKSDKSLTDTWRRFCELESYIERYIRKRGLDLDCAGFEPLITEDDELISSSRDVIEKLRKAVVIN